MSVPLSTYRIQLNAGFDFDAAAGIVDYLHELGISHVYCSPCLQAAPGSTHGYDVVDYHRVNDELGGEAARARFVRTLHDHGMGQVLDIVPNHMAITGARNAWWWDTLENGAFSRYAPYFDIEWNAPEERLRNKILLPVLEDHAGRVIESGKLTLARCGGSFIFRYYEHTFPIAPESMAPLLSECASMTQNGQLGFLADALGRLPVTPDDWSSLAVHHRDKEAIRELLARLCQERPGIAQAIDAAVERWNSDPAALDELLLSQNYRLARWRSASHELAYRRFFDINGLVGLRVEDERVFEDTHQLILKWAQAGQLDGLRVDHPDGLHDPTEYFERLRRAAPDAWIIAEKILQPGEQMPATWPIAGGTGYDFLNLAGGLFVDPRGEAPLNELYRDFTGEPVDFAAVTHEKKLLVLKEILGSDVNRLTALLVQVCEEHREHRDYTRHELHEAVREVIASFPVYRTYARAWPGEISEADKQFISSAIEAARAARPDLDPRLFDFLGDILMLQVQGHAECEFVMRFQQVTSADMAKGVEDTAFYSYNRLVSLNEVGGNPGRLGTSLEDFHRWCAETQARSPHTQLTTSTHDTKRSEDVRSRINILSEIPQAWAEAVARWSAANARYRTGDLPDRKTEYLLYQTLVGAWPISPARLQAYMQKAVREAKERSSWIEPNAVFEEALEKFVAALLDDADFIDDFERFLAPVIESARVASLALALLKLTAPGIPDTYQGTELWDLSLVDPDNRRPVDYRRRRELLRELDGLTVDQILARASDGSPKLWTIRQALRVRNRLPECFGARGCYRALWASGPKADHIVAFQRGDRVITVAPRLVAGVESWRETALDLPEGSWKNQFTQETVPGGRGEVSSLLQYFPVALLTRNDSA